MDVDRFLTIYTAIGGVAEWYDNYATFHAKHQQTPEDSQRWLEERLDQIAVSDLDPSLASALPRQGPPHLVNRYSALPLSRDSCENQSTCWEQF
jgi:hypothetical protein